MKPASGIQRLVSLAVFLRMAMEQKRIEDRMRPVVQSLIREAIMESIIRAAANLNTGVSTARSRDAHKRETNGFNDMTSSFGNVPSRKCVYGCHPSPPEWEHRREIEPRNRLYPIQHPIEFYMRADKLRRWGHNVFGQNSYQRHYHASFILTREYGPNWTRLMGILNEIQSFYWHDLWDLRARIRGERPWAFQLDDFAANEQGIRDAMRKVEK